VQQLQQNMVFCAKTSYGCGSLQNMSQHMVLCAISSGLAAAGLESSGVGPGSAGGLTEQGIS
jgi:hypothetical protein